MAPLRAVPNGPWLKFEIDKTSNWNDTAPSYTDVSQYVLKTEQITWDRGKDATWDQIGPSDLSFGLDNRLAGFREGQVASRRQCRLTAYWPTLGTPIVQFKGIVDMFGWKYPGMGKLSLVQCSAYDLVTVAYLSKMTSLVTLQTTSVGQLTALANAAGIPAGWTSFAPTSYTLKAMTSTQSAILDAMQNVTNAVAQNLFVDRNGILTSISCLGVGASIGTFGDTGGSELPYSGLEGQVGGAGAYSTVSLAQSGNAKAQDGSVMTAVTAKTDPSHVLQYGNVGLVLNVVPSTNPTLACQTWATAVPALNDFRFTQIEFAPMYNPSVLWPIVLTADIGSRLTINRRPAGGSALISQTVFIRRITHSITGGVWKVTWGLANTPGGHTLN